MRLGRCTSARAARVRVRHAVRLRYMISDALSPQVTGTRIVVKTARGKTAATFRIGTEAVAAWRAVKWQPKVKGVYHYCVYATDLAGNAQSKVDSAKVVVR